MPASKFTVACDNDQTLSDQIKFVLQGLVEHKHMLGSTLLIPAAQTRERFGNGCCFSTNSLGVYLPH